MSHLEDIDTPFAKLPREVSIIVPTYHEKLNIQPLVERIDQALSITNTTYEIIFVDDNSQDGTAEVISSLVKNEKYPLHLIIRTSQRGLSSAVLRGFEAAQYETLLVLDADLQHDPKYIPSLIDPIINGLADFSVGSRHIPGGGILDWPVYRRLVSWGATLIARPLVDCSDPMSGFFALSKSTLYRARALNPLGYKIGLELMVRCPAMQIAEIPIIFQPRQQGDSKLTLRTNLLYLMHVGQLYMSCQPLFMIALLLTALLVGLFLIKFIFFYSHRINFDSTHNDNQISAFNNNIAITTVSSASSQNINTAAGAGAHDRTEQEHKEKKNNTNDKNGDIQEQSLHVVSSTTDQCSNKQNLVIPSDFLLSSSPEELQENKNNDGVSFRKIN